MHIPNKTLHPPVRKVSCIKNRGMKISWLKKFIFIHENEILMHETEIFIHRNFHLWEFHAWKWHFHAWIWSLSGAESRYWSLGGDFTSVKSRDGVTVKPCTYQIKPYTPPVRTVSCMENRGRGLQPWRFHGWKLLFSCVKVKFWCMKLKFSSIEIFMYENFMHENDIFMHEYDVTRGNLGCRKSLLVTRRWFLWASSLQ